jgi:hypothetical protein
VPWRITVDQLSQVLSPKEAANLTIPDSPEAPIRWQSALGVDVDDLIGQVRAGLDADYPAVQAFLPAFERLLDQVRAASFTLDYREAARPVPPLLEGKLELAATLLHAAAFLTHPEREELRRLFPDGDDRAAAEHLLQDLADREVLEDLYDGWLIQEPVSQAVALDSLPAELRERVELQAEPVAIRHHGILSHDEARALQALCASDEDRGAIQRLLETSVDKGLGGSELKILARRGAAAPSPRMRDLEATPLVQ